MTVPTRIYYMHATYVRRRKVLTRLCFYLQRVDLAFLLLLRKARLGNEVPQTAQDIDSDADDHPAVRVVFAEDDAGTGDLQEA